jgi:SAM-dependent methyltransferase
MTVDYEALWGGHTWGGMQDLGPVHRHTRRIIVETARTLDVRSVLDVGCGNGSNLEGLQQGLGLTDVTGLDISPTAIEAARRRVRGDFKVVDVAHEGLALDRTYDFVLSSQVIEHVEDDDAFLSALRGACGRYVFVGTMQGRMRKSELRIGHLRNYTRRGLEAKMQAAGFSIERVIEWGFPFYSPLYRTLIEYIGGQTADISYDRKDRIIAALLYHLYRLNMSTRGDVLMILARAA